MPYLPDRYWRGGFGVVIKCSWPECERQAASRGYCHRHYQSARKQGRLPETWERAKSSLWKTNEQRLLEKIAKQPNGCWLWTARLSPQGYGQSGYYLNGRYRGVRAHRLAYEVWAGEIPPGMFVRHKCDNKGCINPEHLELGTHADNMADLAARGRRKGMLAGENNGRAKLTQHQADQIRKLYASGRFSQEELGEMYGVSQYAVSAIVRNIRYAV